MPELAEVETVRLRLDKIMHKKKITAVIVDDQDRFFYAFAKPAEIRKALLGAKVISTGRRGKYFWLNLSTGQALIMHLGMTGNLSILLPKKSSSHQKIWGGIKLWNQQDKNDRDRLWFCRLLITLQDGTEIAVLDPRRFGRVWLSEDPGSHPKIARLGPDPLVDFPNAKVLGEKLKKRRGPIKAVLLDQKLFAGVGNWLADEILYQAKIAPRRSASSLNTTEIKKLHDKVISVCKKAVDYKADYEQFPKTWLFHERWGKSKNAQVQGQKIVHEEIGGRTTAWVPTRQS